MRVKCAVGILVFAVVSALSIPVMAGDEVEPSGAQLELNQQGVEAIIAEDYERAVRLFEASTDLGELNITYLNKGRAYQHNGQCEMAEKSYGQALEAPQVKSPTPEEVQETVVRYRDELREECPGYLEITCDPEDMSVYIDDQEGTACDAQSRWELMPGGYEVRGEYGEETTTASISIEALRLSQLELGLDVVTAADPVGEGVADVELDYSSGFEMPSPWLWIAASGAALVGGVVLDTVPDRASNYEFNAINLVPPTLYVSSAVLAFFGVRGLRR